MGDIGPAEDQPRPSRSSLPVPNPTKSYWQTSHPNDLVNHHSTPHLPSLADVVIIGSGITAVFAARELLQSTKDAHVLVLEARTTCSGATGRNGGHLQPIIHEQAPHVIDFEFSTFKHVVSLIEQHDIPCDFRRLEGVLGFWRQDFFEEAKEELEKSRRTDPKHAAKVRVVDDQEGLKKLRIPGAVGANVQTTAASLSPYKLVIWLWRDLINRYGPRINLQTSTPVTAITAPTSLGMPINTFTAINVVTERGDVVQTAHCILATNGYTSHLLDSMTGVITPTQGQMSALEPPPLFAKNLIPHSYGFMGVEEMDKIESDYLVQGPPATKLDNSTDQGGCLMYGGARALVPGGGSGVFDDSYVDERAEQYLRELPQRLDLVSPVDSQPGSAKLQELPMVASWTGIMGYSKDHFPWVGAVPGRRGTWISAGYTGHGMPNAPGCGRHVARLVAEAINGKDWKARELQALDRKEIPPEYVCTSERLTKAQRAEIDANGLIPDSDRKVDVSTW